MKKSTLNITAGTDVVLNDTLMFQGEVFDPSLSVNVEANLISGLGKRSALSFEIEDTHMIIYVPWEEGRLTGCYGLEVRGVTNGRKWATYSDSLIRYTKATEDGASSVTDDGDVYDITQTVAYRYSVSPIKEITADTDGLTGTPSVSVDYDGKDIAFHFYGIKGEKGDAFTYDDFTPEELESLRGPQGPKGNDGLDGVVLDPEAVTIFDDMADLDGKTEEQKHEMLPNGNIAAGVHTILGDIAYISRARQDENVDISSCPIVNNFWIGNSTKPNIWETITGARVFWVATNGYQQVTITANQSTDSYLFITRDNAQPVNGAKPDFATGESARHIVSHGQTQSILLPSDARYIAFSGVYSQSVNATPSAIILSEEQHSYAKTNNDLHNGNRLPLESTAGEKLAFGSVKTYGVGDVEWTDGKGVKAHTGAIESLSNHCYTQIECADAKYLDITLLKYTSATQYGLAFFDAHGIFLGGKAFEGNLSVSWGIYRIIVPSNAAYFITTWVMASHPSYGSFNQYFSCDVVCSGLYKRRDNDVLVGAVYFDGWSYTRGIPYNQISSLLMSAEWNFRQPLTGWITERSDNAVAWLKSPFFQIGLNGLMTFESNCVFWSDTEQCRLFVREKDTDAWVDMNISLPDAADASFVSTNVDLSAFAGKEIQIGFRLKNSEGRNSAIWQIKSLNITDGGGVVMARDFTYSAQRDFLTDGLYWEAGDYGYNGNTYNLGDTLSIDREIALAKSNGIDYFAFCWYPIFNGDEIDDAKINGLRFHHAMRNLIRSCNKYDMKFCIYIANHGTYGVSGQTKWNNTIKYILDNYSIDQCYLKTGDKPIIFIFGNPGTTITDNINTYVSANTEYTHGIYFCVNSRNTWYNCFSFNHICTDSGTHTERPMSDITQGQISRNNADVVNLVPTATVGWNSQPWIAHHPEVVNQDYFTRNNTTDVTAWREQLEFLFGFTHKLPYEFKSFIIYAWNEIGEGGYLMPTKGDPKGLYLRTIGEVKNNQHF